MKKLKKKFIIIVCVMVFLAISVKILLLFDSGVFFRIPEFQGDIFLTGDAANEYGGSIVKVKEGVVTSLYDKDLFYYVEANKTADKLLLVKSISSPKEADYAIYEYDISSDSMTPLIRCFGTGHYYCTISFHCVRYVPESNKISYLWKDELHIFDLETKEDEIEAYIDEFSFYSWAKDGNSFLCSLGDGKIYSYDMESGGFIYLFDGERPEYSVDNNSIAYLKGSWTLVVRNMTDGSEISRKYMQPANNYRFSPDNNNIIFCVTVNGPIMVGTYEKIVVWDIKRDRVRKLVHDAFNSIGVDWK